MGLQKGERCSVNRSHCVRYWTQNMFSEGEGGALQADHWGDQRAMCAQRALGAMCAQIPQTMTVHVGLDAQ